MPNQSKHVLRTVNELNRSHTLNELVAIRTEITRLIERKRAAAGDSRKLAQPKAIVVDRIRVAGLQLTGN